MNLQLSKIFVYDNELINLPNRKLLITTINANAYNVAQTDKKFAEALHASDILLPDGISVVFAVRILKQKRLYKIAGADLFQYEMNKLNKTGGKCFFLGSNIATLNKIEANANKVYPNVKIFTYSPPYVKEFSEDESLKMISEINKVEPDVLFIGMTAPKQEKWAFQHYDKLKVGHIGCIGAVFDFFAGNIKRAPRWMINIGLEWLYRLLKEPRRMWRRYLIGNTKFMYSIMIEKFFYSNF